MTNHKRLACVTLDQPGANLVWNNLVHPLYKQGLQNGLGLLRREQYLSAVICNQ